jgi:hypothetical protein
VITAMPAEILIVWLSITLTVDCGDLKMVLLPPYAGSGIVGGYPPIQRISKICALHEALISMSAVAHGPVINAMLRHLSENMCMRSRIA